MHPTCPEHGLLKPCLHCEPAEAKYAPTRSKDVSTLPPSPRQDVYIKICSGARAFDLLAKCDQCSGYHVRDKSHGEP